MAVGSLQGHQLPIIGVVADNLWDEIVVDVHTSNIFEHAG